MKTNVVLVDRTIRMGLGMLLVASPLLELPTFPFNLLGLVLIVTAAAGWCPIYGFLSLFAAPHGTKPSLAERSVTVRSRA
jgi:hypothetical protein